MIIYVASPHGGKKKNIKYNAECCISVIANGHIPLSPHQNFIYLNDKTDRELALRMGRDLIRLCDEVWLFIENGKSAGMLEEEAYARKLNKPVKYVGAI
jgi:hypothetical protein